MKNEKKELLERLSKLNLRDDLKNKMALAIRNDSDTIEKFASEEDAEAVVDAFAELDHYARIDYVERDPFDDDEESDDDDGEEIVVRFRAYDEQFLALMQTDERVVVLRDNKRAHGVDVFDNVYDAIVAMREDYEPRDGGFDYDVVDIESAQAAASLDSVYLSFFSESYIRGEVEDYVELADDDLPNWLCEAAELLGITHAESDDRFVVQTRDEKIIGAYEAEDDAIDAMNDSDDSSQDLRVYDRFLRRVVCERT